MKYFAAIDYRNVKKPFQSNTFEHATSCSTRNKLSLISLTIKFNIKTRHTGKTNAISDASYCHLFKEKIKEYIGVFCDTF
jgi:hypothetical protein